MNHKGTKRIETERLILRPFREDDAKPLFRNWASDPEVTKFLTWPAHKTVEVSRQVVKSWVEENPVLQNYQWAIELKEIHEPIGSISAVKVDDRTESAEIGYCIGRNWWGQGITAEALKAVIAFFFDEVGMNCVKACHDPGNPNSGKVMKKCGMIYEGTRRANGVNNQGICDEAWYSILRKEYENEKKNVFIEGIQGMGKSTLLQDIYTRIPEFHVCREGDYSPVDLAWCAWLTEKEYQLILEQYDVLHKEILENTVREGNHYIVSYTKIITDIPGFHKELERFEIYNGRKTLQELEEIILSRYRNFSGTGYLFECAFMQNIVEDLILFHQLSDDEIIAFYRRLYDILQKEDFLLLYLYSDKIEESTKAIRAERSDNQGNALWYDMMMAYLVNSPYGQKCGYKGFDDLVTHFRHRQRVELRIINEVLGEHARILPAKQWNMDEVIHYIRG